ncbi:cystathionine gamma-synthase [Pseudoclavibacter chungangensis]|uniref:homocysteine desulfhydrase n=1 Tax=Pseudoclavibacter chungangensis TaxID=587635 RepID=A0A7J5BSJ5_9MICO|nr:cystathionine gamma-synthase [Pseudoclavibacter chungangensis]KAB1657284.1 cystathionine gamma-synthase [Pseudoclavibacter chungangensis]NYJ66269.1 cystathionine gamma-synthase [Pseudoclavibacter chungangensis]
MTEPSRLTRALHTGFHVDPVHGAVAPPLYLTSTFTFESLGEPREHDYTRSSNPTRDLFGEAVSELEGGAGGTVVASGMAASSLVVLSLVGPDDLVLVPQEAYGGTWRLFDTLAREGRLRVEFVDATDTERLTARIAAAKPRLVWVETPSNPLLRLTDIAAVSTAAHEAGALVVADNTFLTPLGQRPLELGADIVVHSATKFLNGHSDLVSGVVVAGTPELHARFRHWGNVLGVTGSPFDAYQALRGLRTLDVRWRRHLENTAAVVAAIADHPAVSAIHYPGLPDHPEHDLAGRQQDGYGALVSFELAGGRDAVARFLDGLQLFGLAVSLGGVESLVAHPETMTHASMSAEARERAGIGSGLVRLSIGIDTAEDLVADLLAGLDRAR